MYEGSCNYHLASKLLEQNVDRSCDRHSECHSERHSERHSDHHSDHHSDRHDRYLIRIDPDYDQIHIASRVDNALLANDDKACGLEGVVKEAEEEELDRVNLKRMDEEGTQHA